MVITLQLEMHSQWPSHYNKFSTTICNRRLQEQCQNMLYKVKNVFFFVRAVVSLLIFQRDSQLLLLSLIINLEQV